MQQGPSGPTSQALRGHAGQHSAGSFLPDATRSGSLALTNANRNASGEEPCNGPRGSGNVFVASALDTRLFTMYQQPPAPGFQKISQTQLVRADRHAFVRLNELRMGSLKPGADARLPLSHHLPPKFKPPELSVGALRSSAGKVRAAVRQSTRFFGDPAMDQTLWDKTLTEVEKGWLVGPMEWEMLTGSEVVSKRFPLQEGQKVRPIDDYSVSSINATVTQWERPTAKNHRCHMLLDGFPHAGT